MLSCFCRFFKRIFRQFAVFLGEYLAILPIFQANMAKIDETKNDEIKNDPAVDRLNEFIADLESHIKNNK